MIRILQVVNIMDRAGIENMLMNYYRAIDKTEIQFDFLTHRPVQGAFDEEIREMGGKVYYAPRLYPQNYANYFRFMKDFFEEHKEYTIVHSHIDSMSYLPLLAAKKAGIPVRIAHSHSTSIDMDFKWLLKQLFRKRICSVANEFAACSTKAGEYLFGKTDFKLIYNAIDENRFAFDPSIREKMQIQLGLQGKFVIGHVGRFTAAKNHRFLVDVFKGALEKRDDIVLLLVGAGECLENVKAYISECKLNDRVTILSNRDDVHELYQAMDLFLFPSLYEGLGMSAVEAQISGVPTIASVNVPKEVKISDKLCFLELKEKMWVDAVIKAKTLDCRMTKYSSNYDIYRSASKLAEFYKALQ